MTPKAKKKDTWDALNIVLSRKDIERGLRLVAASYPSLTPLELMMTDGERSIDAVDTFVTGALEPPF